MELCVTCIISSSTYQPHFADITVPDGTAVPSTGQHSNATEKFTHRSSTVQRRRYLSMLIRDKE